MSYKTAEREREREREKKKKKKRERLTAMETGQDHVDVKHRCINIEVCN